MIKINKPSIQNPNGIFQNQCPNTITEFKTLKQDTVSFRESSTSQVNNLYNDFRQQNNPTAKLFNKLASLEDSAFQHFLNIVKTNVLTTDSNAIGDRLYKNLNKLKDYLNEQNLPKGAMVSKTVQELSQ